MDIKREPASPDTTRLGNITYGHCFHVPNSPRTIYVLLDTACGSNMHPGNEKVYVASLVNGNTRTMAISRQVVSLNNAILLPHGEGV